MKLIKEFKEFAIKGNMFDMAVGIIIGTAFNQIVTSLVKDILTPFFAVWVGNTPFQDIKLILKPELKNPEGTVIQEMISVNFGAFIQTSLDFLIITASIFIVIKAFNTLRAKSQDETNPTVPTPKEIVLLSEIRDLLKKNNA